MWISCIQKGITKYINRRAKTPLKQLRLKDKTSVKSVDPRKRRSRLFENLQLETKTGEHYTEKQEKFVLEVYKEWGKEKRN